MASANSNDLQRAIARHTGRLLAVSRRRQKLTQADVAGRMNGAVSKAALANYETGHRSVRIEVLVVILLALGEDVGEFMTTVVLAATDSAQLSVNVWRLLESTEPRLEAIRRWWTADHPSMKIPNTEVIRLSEPVLMSLAHLMNTTPNRLIMLLKQAGVLSRN